MKAKNRAAEDVRDVTVNSEQECVECRVECVSDKSKLSCIQNYPVQTNVYIYNPKQHLSER